MPTPPPDFVRNDLTALGIDVTNAQLEQLAHFLDLLLDANEKVNLTSIRDRDEAWKRHIIDSLTSLPAFTALPEGRAIDVGTGGGLPGLPLAIMCPHLSFTLADATGKKVRIVEQIATELGLAHVIAVQQRAEQLGQDPTHRQVYDIAVTRAIGPMNVLLEYCLPLVKVGGAVVAMKGPSVERELDEAGDALATLGAGNVEVIEAYPEDFGVNTVIVLVAKERPTPKTYPRAPGVPKQSPL